MIRENGDIGGGQGRNQDDYDIKVFQYRKQQAELKRNQQEEDLRENHPYFDTPLFAISRESNFRKFFQLVVEARYDGNPKDRPGQESKISRYKQGQYVDASFFPLLTRFSVNFSVWSRISIGL